MPRSLALIGVLALSPLLSGCIAAALPVLAAGTVVRSQTDDDAGNGGAQTIVYHAAPAGPREPILARASALIPSPAAPAITAPASPSPPPPRVPVPDFADSSFTRFVSHVTGRARLVEEGAPVVSLVLANGLLAREPEFVQCRQQRAAVIIDLDDGREDGAAPAPPDHQVAANPDMIRALSAVRAANVDIVWITGDRTLSPGDIAARLQSSGLDPAGQDPVLVPESPADRKQLQRLRATSTRCIIAVVGDRRSDADEVYDYLRDPTTPLAIDANWDAGWFILPPPLGAAPISPGEE